MRLNGVDMYAVEASWIDTSPSYFQHMSTQLQWMALESLMVYPFGSMEERPPSVTSVGLERKVRRSVP